MSILNQGCACDTCYRNTLKNLRAAREKWSNGEREIIFKPYHHTCGDGCCDDYGTDVYVNGFDLNCDGENAESVVKSLMEFLEFDDVSIEYEYEDEN